MRGSVPCPFQNHYTLMDLKQILEDASTIAVVGCSNQPWRPSFRISAYLIDAGYEVIPVNPEHETVHGLRCYPDLKSIPGDVRIDIVNIFRRPQFTADMVRMAVAYAEATDTKPVIWTQLGVSSPEASQLAADAGLPYVHNRCILVEHSRLIATPT